MGGDEDATERSEWTLGGAMASVEQKLEALGLPKMTAPAGLNEEYTFPSDVGNLTNIALGTLQLKLTGFYSYTNLILGTEESKLGALEMVFDQRIGVAMNDVATSSEKRIIKEAQRSLAIDGDPKLKQMLELIIERRALVKRLDVQAEVYKEQVVRLSREQSRRESEAHRGA